ncbi:MAG: hypothetical protein LH616_18030, partial [Ilumatobacteraceae bacterium]|nr:hypothetical protein [Ilumatobacteraceae bacterium]
MKVREEQGLGVVLVLAVATTMLSTVAFAKVADQRANFWDRAVHPDGQNRVTARDPDPAERIRQRHAVLSATANVNLGKPRKTGAAAHGPEPGQGDVCRLGRRRNRCRPDGGQQVCERGFVTQQEVQQGNPLRVDAVHLRQRINLFNEQVDG